MSTASLDVSKVRSHFPALQKYPDFVFGDNAGGSQILADAADRVHDYLINTNIQMGSDYMITSTQRCMNLAQEHAAKLFNAESPDEIVFGASSTQNVDNLARGLENDIKSDDEIIITGEHEGMILILKKLIVTKLYQPMEVHGRNLPVELELL
jgi:selenocysteine lyase/cysteine desulfurase